MRYIFSLIFHCWFLVHTTYNTCLHIRIKFAVILFAGEMWMPLDLIKYFLLFRWKRNSENEIDWIRFQKIWKVQYRVGCVEVTANRKIQIWFVYETKELKHHRRAHFVYNNGTFLFNFIIFLSFAVPFLPWSCSNNVCNYIFFCWCCWIFLFFSRMNRAHNAHDPFSFFLCFLSSASSFVHPNPHSA